MIFLMKMSFARAKYCGFRGFVVFLVALLSQIFLNSEKCAKLSAGSTQLLNDVLCLYIVSVYFKRGFKGFYRFQNDCATSLNITPFP